MAPILLEVEPEYQGLAQAFSALVERLKQRRQAALSGKRIPYAELEREVAQGAGAIERAAHATLLLALDVDAPQVTIEGTAYRRVLRTAGTYYTMAGPVEVMRTLYRLVGARRAATVDAVSVQRRPCRR